MASPVVTCTKSKLRNNHKNINTQQDDVTKMYFIIIIIIISSY